MKNQTLQKENYNKIYKKNISSILFSKNNKNMKKVNLAIIIIVFIETIFSLFMIDTIGNGSKTLNGVMFSAGQMSSLIFIMTGYTWYSKNKIKNKIEFKWLIVMTILGTLNLFIRYIFASNYKLLIFIPFYYLCPILLHAIQTFISKRHDDEKIYIKLTNIIMISTAMIFFILVYFISSDPELGLNTFILILLSAMAINFISFAILKKVKKGIRNHSLIDSNESIVVVGFGVVCGLAIFMAKQFFSSMDISAIPAIFIPIQLSVAALCGYIMLRSKKDLDNDYMKSLIMNVGIMIELGSVFISKSILVVQGESLNGYLVNIWIAVLCIAFLYGIIVAKRIIRDGIFRIIDSLTIISIFCSFYSLSILQSFDILFKSAAIGVDEFILFASILFNVINLTVSIWIWFLSLSKRNKEKVWK